MTSPFRNTANDLAKPLPQSPSDIIFASGRNHAISFDVGAANRTSLKPLAPPEDRMLLAERDHFAGELEQVFVRVVPIQPRQFTVLAIGIVVALLAATHLVASQQASERRATGTGSP